MSTILWAGVLLAALWAAHWGAEQFSKPLKKLRKQWGFSVAAAAPSSGLTGYFGLTAAKRLTSGRSGIWNARLKPMHQHWPSLASRSPQLSTGVSL